MDSQLESTPPALLRSLQHNTVLHERAIFPTLLTILGVIMYLRQGSVVGNAGLGGAWLVIGLDVGGSVGEAAGPARKGLLFREGGVNRVRLDVVRCGILSRSVGNVSSGDYRQMHCAVRGDLHVVGRGSDPDPVLHLLRVQAGTTGAASPTRSSDTGSC